MSTWVHTVAAATVWARTRSLARSLARTSLTIAVSSSTRVYLCACPVHSSIRCGPLSGISETRNETVDASRIVRWLLLISQRRFIRSRNRWRYLSLPLFAHIRFSAARRNKLEVPPFRIREIRRCPFSLSLSTDFSMRDSIVIRPLDSVKSR